MSGNSQSVVGERWIEEGKSERRYLNFTLRSEPRIAGYKVMATVCGPPPTGLVGQRAWSQFCRAMCERRRGPSNLRLQLIRLHFC